MPASPGCAGGWSVPTRPDRSSGLRPGPIPESPASGSRVARGHDGMILVLFAAVPADGVFNHFANSMAISSAKLSFLGDIFAIPKSLPLSNVFSVGDICVAAGAVVTLHRVSGSALIPSGRGQFAPLFKQPTFMRL